MPFDPEIAAIRFGTGLSPVIPPPASAAEMIDRLTSPDEAAARIPIEPYSAQSQAWIDFGQASRALREGTPAEIRVANARRREVRKEGDAARIHDSLAVIARNATALDALRERLALFWADHFTVIAKATYNARFIQPFVDETIRPRMTGTFADLLVAVETHPMMLIYLDQAGSIGPGSRVGINNHRGLNENLARELMELHTLGVGAPYAQDDVRQLAELLTGLTVQQGGVMQFRAERAEPGSETILGHTYSDQASLENVEAALRDIAVHPATAAHIARKLVVHFVADEPDPDLVAHLTDVFAGTGGDLTQVVAALLDHPASWSPVREKVKPPIDFMTSSLRALGLADREIMALDDKEARRSLLNPLGVMGQPWLEPGGPDGWPEAAEAWVTPQFVATRIDWAMNRPEELLRHLPDPRAFVATALGSTAGEAVAFAARAAERPAEGVGVVLASADFQRR